ncbi:hypothetical protein [Streptomyces chartreusis]|uniref:hypothetical protein n=1 Tax=Streptomyces chartreusis TaxID=1969 RepID=UPI003805373E
MPLLRRAYDESLGREPRLLAEHIVRLASDAGGQQALEELAARRKDDDPDQQRHAILANGRGAHPPPRGDHFFPAPPRCCHASLGG